MVESCAECNLLMCCPMRLGGECDHGIHEQSKPDWLVQEEERNEDYEAEYGRHWTQY